MHKNFCETIEKITTWANRDGSIQGIIIIGSQVRRELIADQWSDVDLMLLANDPHPLLTDAAWLDTFGNVVCFFNEVTVLPWLTWNWCVTRALYDDNRAIDFSILPADHLDEVLSVNKEIMSKGYRVIYDANAGRLDTKICTLLETVQKEKLVMPTEEELRNIIREILFHVIWSFKKIKQKELWVAVNCINGRIQNLLLRLIEAHNISITQRSTVVMHEGRFLEQRADRELIEKLKNCFTQYDEIDAAETLEHIIDFTSSISEAIGEKNGYTLDPKSFNMVKKLYRGMK